MNHSIRGEQLIPRNRRMDNAESKEIEEDWNCGGCKP